jgi:MFS family permease
MQATASPRRTTENGRIVAALALSLLLASLGTSIANIALPTLAGAFGAPFAQVQWVVIGYLGALTVSVVVAGRLGDVYGLRRMLVGGLSLFALASLACGLAPSLPALIAARAVQGVGAAFLMTLSLALVRETLGEAQTGRAMGLLGTVSALGTAMGPTLGGLVIAAADWRGVFLVQVPLAVLALSMALVWLPRDTSTKRSPSRLKAILPEAAMLPGLAVNLLVAAVMMTTLLVGPFFLRLWLGLGEVATGLVMSVGPVISILGGVPSGRAVDTWGAGRVILIGLALLSTGVIALAVLPGALGVAGYVLGIAVLTPG